MRMKNIFRSFWCLSLLLAATSLFSGCVAIPPLINVEHKNADSDVSRKLDSIEQRLESLERKLDQKN
jgi:hypothetical protein